MRIIPILLLFLLLFVVSCKPLYRLGRQPTPVAPFVLLKDSTRITAKEVGQENGFGRERIIADDRAFERNDVATYSNGEQTYTNHRGSFLPLIATGNISVYSNSDSRMFGYQEGYGERLYLQNKHTAKLEKFGCRSLKKNIQRGDPGYEVLRQYRSTKRILVPTMVGSLACFVGGAIIAGDAVNKNQSDAKINTGLVMTFGSMGLIVGTTIPLFTNKNKLRRALAIHNGVYPQ